MSFTPLSQQRLAIEAGLGPVLVVAGPGAGKTFCLIARIEHLISAGIDPQRICAVTFTNRAAEEIALRLGDRAEQITRGTIHAFCLAVLREFVAEAGRAAWQFLRCRRRRAVDLRLDRRGSVRPGALSPRLRRRAHHPRQESALLAADLRDGAAGAGPESQAVPEAADGGPGITARGRGARLPRRAFRADV